MLENLIEKEICISENIEQFLTNLIGTIDCGEATHIGDSLIIELEDCRKNNARKGVIALYETFIGDGILDGPKHLMSMFPSGKMSSLDFERLISYFLLGQFNVTYSKAKQAQKSAGERRHKTSGIKLEMERRIHKRWRYYTSQLASLISNLQEHIETLEETQLPTIDFNNTNITYKKRIKIPQGGK